MRKISFLSVDINRKETFNFKNLEIPPLAKNKYNQSEISTSSLCNYYRKLDLFIRETR